MLPFPFNIFLHNFSYIWMFLLVIKPTLRPSCCSVLEENITGLCEVIHFKNFIYTEILVFVLIIWSALHNYLKRGQKDTKRHWDLLLLWGSLGLFSLLAKMMVIPFRKKELQGRKQDNEIDSKHNVYGICPKGIQTQKSTETYRLKYLETINFWTSGYWSNFR